MAVQEHFQYFPVWNGTSLRWNVVDSHRIPQSFHHFCQVTCYKIVSSFLGVYLMHQYMKINLIEVLLIQTFVQVHRHGTGGGWIVMHWRCNHLWFSKICKKFLYHLECDSI